MDLTIDVEDYRLNIRVGGIIEHENKILLHKETDKNYYALIGGRIQTGESSEHAIIREMEEEIGKKVEVKNYIATIENFFEANDKKYQEILFVYKMEFTNENDKLITKTIKNIEGNDNLNYEWIDINKIDEYDIKPKIIKEILKDKNFPVHKINET